MDRQEFAYSLRDFPANFEKEYTILLACVQTLLASVNE